MTDINGSGSLPGLYSQHVIGEHELWRIICDNDRCGKPERVNILANKDLEKRLTLQQVQKGIFLIVGTVLSLCQLRGKVVIRVGEYFPFVIYFRRHILRLEREMEVGVKLSSGSYNAEYTKAELWREYVGGSLVSPHNMTKWGRAKSISLSHQQMQHACGCEKTNRANATSQLSISKITLQRTNKIPCRGGSKSNIPQLLLHTLHYF